MTQDANGTTIRPGDVVEVISEQCAFYGQRVVVAEAPSVPDLPVLSMIAYAVWLKESHGAAINDVFSTRSGAMIFGKFVVVKNKERFEKSEKTFEQLLSDING